MALTSICAASIGVEAPPSAAANIILFLYACSAGPACSKDTLRILFSGVWALSDNIFAFNIAFAVAAVMTSAWADSLSLRENPMSLMMSAPALLTTSMSCPAWSICVVLI